jgi:hypothetical protein
MWCRAQVKLRGEGSGVKVSSWKLNATALWCHAVFIILKMQGSGFGTLKGQG